MSDISKSISLLIKSIEDEASKEEKSILERAREDKRKKLSQLKSEIKQKYLEQSRRDVADAINAANRRCGEIMSDERRAVGEIRRGTAEKILDGVSQRLESFTKSAAYADYLSACAKSAANAFGTGGVLHMKTGDEQYENMVCEILKPESALFDDGIAFGGFIVEYKARGISADQTLGARFEEKKSEFERNSGFDF